MTYRHRPVEPLRAVVFDLDGTLVDTAQDIANALNDALGREGLRAVPLQVVRRMIGDGVRALVAKALRWQGVEPAADGVERLYRAFMAFSLAEPVGASTLFPGMDRLMRDLHDAGVRIGVCTNKQHELARRVVDALGMADLVDRLVGGGSLPMKPDPAPLLATIEGLGTSAAAAVYVGDMLVDYRTAIAADVAFLVVDHGDWRTDLSGLAPPFVARGADELGRILIGHDRCAPR